MQDSLQDLIESAGLEARCFGSAEEFLESGLHRQAACLITDIRMPKMSGLELQSRLKEEECSVPIIFITAHGDTRMRIRAIERVQSSSLRNRSIIKCCSKGCERHLICNQPVFTTAPRA